MVLSNKGILDNLVSGSIKIDPFHKDGLQTSSYDVRLGKYYCRQIPATEENMLFAPYSQEAIDSLWGRPQKAESAGEVCERLKQNIPKNVKADDLVIIIYPKELILVHTIEFIGGRFTVTSSMQAKSTTGRDGLRVCSCAGWGDIGYVNRWTMELENSLNGRITMLKVGSWLAQIVFDEAGEIVGGNYTGEGRYQETDDFELLKKSWNPNMMLPKPMKCLYP